MPQQPGLSQLNLVVRDMDATLGLPPPRPQRRSRSRRFPRRTHLPSGMLLDWDCAEFFFQWNTDGTGRPEAAPCSASG